MGLVGKLKNILFEEEEVEIPVLEKKEKKNSNREEPIFKEMPQKEEKTELRKTELYHSFYDDEEDIVVKEPPKNVMQPVQEPKIEQPKESEMFRSEKTFNFPAFDEDEFENTLHKKSVNVVEEPRKKVTTSRVMEYNNSRTVKQEEVKPTKFRPSPIISPVYGILDKNYTPDEITTRNSSNSKRNLDVDSVRKKAFGIKLEAEEKIIVKEGPKKTAEEKILEEKLEKARTIDELLKDSSDDIISVSPKDEEIIPKKNSKELENVEPIHKNDEEDTLENDLFDLIDSMYENREDGE